MTEIIGAGEVTACDILQHHYGYDTIVKIQVPISTLFTEQFKHAMSERERKQTIDIVIYPKNRKTIAVRVQDKHHCTKMMSRKDENQRKVLNMCGVDVLDLYYYDCPHLFKEDFDLGYNEILQCMQDQNIK